MRRLWLSKRLPLGLVGMLFLLSVERLSLAEVLTFQTTANGTFVVTGNTLGRASESTLNGPGLVGSTHTFVTVDTGLTDSVPADPSNPWPAGTTSNCELNSSAAQLVLPPGSSVIWAELVWGGSYRYLEDVSAHLDSGVTFATPAGSGLIAPDAGTAVTLDFFSGAGFSVAYYVRSANVTSIVANAGSGVYTVGGVPATQNEAINSLNAVGWTLIVAVAKADLPCRTLHLSIGVGWVDESTSQTITFSGLGLPAAGEVNGRFITGAIDGDADHVGDTVAIKDPISELFLSLSGPNNPTGNFFASQINTEAGALDTLGTLGILNHDAASGVNLVGARQGWDHTGIPLGSSAGTLGNGQTETSVRFASTGDSLVVTFAGLEVDTSADCPEDTLIFSDGFESGTFAGWSSKQP